MIELRISETFDHQSVPVGFGFWSQGSTPGLEDIIVCHRVIGIGA